MKFNREQWDAVLFDLDGVLTQTATLHAAAWKQMFDDYLRARAALTGDEFAPFEIATDYKEFIDGKLRYDGVRSFLESRGVHLPEGDSSDSPELETVRGLGNRKNDLITELIETKGVEVYPSSIRWLRFLHADGVKTAVVSASKNCQTVLRVTGIAGHFDTRVDGDVAEERGLKGKPAPDTFLEAARVLGVDPKRAVVVEDAIAGVQSGKAGGFGLVVGVDRKGDPESLHEAGADIVVQDLAELEG